MFLEKHLFCSMVFVVFASYFAIFNCDDMPQEEEEKKPKEGMESVKEKLEGLMLVPPMPFLTSPAPLIFEGVDYDLLQNLSQKYYDEYYDCFYWHTKCIRDTSYFHTVCGYHYYKGFVSFANPCQMELENCRYRVRDETWKPYQGIYGTGVRQYYDIYYTYYYNGDGFNCKYNFRRNVPDDQVNFYYEDEEIPTEFDDS